MSTIEIGAVRIGHLGLGKWETGPNYILRSVGINLSYYHAGNKEIKYLTFVCVPYNQVNDIVANEASCKLTGPIAPKTVARNVMFDKVWSDTNIKKVAVKRVLIEYMDGTEESIDENHLVLMENEESAYHKEVRIPENERQAEEDKEFEKEWKRKEKQRKKEEEKRQEHKDNAEKITYAKTTSEYLELIERCKDDEELLIYIVSCATNLESRYLVGDEIERRFSSNDKLMTEVVESWKAAIEYQQKYYNLPESKNLKGYPEKYAEKIKKYRPSYEMPKKAGCVTIGK